MKLVFTFLILAGVAFGQGPIRDSSFFGVHLASPGGSVPYPQARSVRPGFLRVWDANTVCSPGTAWEKINTSNGVYDWTCLDALLALAATNKMQVMYTFGRTPSWAAPDDAACTAYGHGTCDPPTDLTKFRDFANALFQHAAGTTYGKICCFETWNEANLQRMFNGAASGNSAALRTMHGYVQTARATYCSACLVGLPSVTSTGDYTTDESVSLVGGPHLAVNDWLGKGLTADFLPYHNYGTPGSPESSSKTITNQMRDSVTARNGLPVWNTEFSCGGALADIAEQAWCLARYTIFLAGRDEIARSIWYGWDYGDTRAMWITTQSDLTPTGWAYYQVFEWLNGAKFTDALDSTSGTRCTITGTVWTCHITKANGVSALLVWDTSGSSSFAVTPFTKYRTIDNGNLKTIVGANITIGLKPLLLE